MSPSTAIPHNLGVYRLQGFSGRQEPLLALHRWLTDPESPPALAISGSQGNGKSTLATAAAWNTIHHFADGVIWVGAAGGDRFRLYDVVRTLDSVLGTTLTRVSEDRWGIGILEQLYRRRRLLILDELSGATESELRTLVEIIGHLQDSGGQSHILLIDRDLHPEIRELVGEHHLALEGLDLAEAVQLTHRRCPEAARSTALRHIEALHRRSGGRPLSLRLLYGLLLDFGTWQDLELALAELPRRDDQGQVRMAALAAFAVENFAAFWPQAGPLLDRLVRAAGGATFTALRELFWAGLGSEEEFKETLQGLVERALVEENPFDQRILVQPVVRRYLVQSAAMLGEEWDRQHAGYYLHLARRYEELPLHRWTEVDPEWGNIHLGADWVADRVERLWGRPALELVAALETQELPEPLQPLPEVEADLRLARDYGLALAHYAFWRHPPGILRWLAAGGVAAHALGDIRDLGWLLANIGRQLFFRGDVEEAVGWLRRALRLFDEHDLVTEMAYAYTDLGTSLRILDEARMALDYFWLAFEAVAQLGDTRSLIAAYLNLGSAYFSLQNYERAVEQHRKALRIALRLGANILIASTFNNLGLALEAMEHFDQARQAYLQALQYFQLENDLLGISTCYNNLGSVAYAQQRLEEAERWYRQDLALSEQRGAWMDMAATLHNLGHVALEQGDLEQARQYFLESRDLYGAFQLAEYVQEEEEMIRYIDSLREPQASGADL